MNLLIYCVQCGQDHPKKDFGQKCACGGIIVAGYGGKCLVKRKGDKFR